MSTSLSSYDSCPICYDDYMETPKALQCLHSFCQKCLQAYISSNAKRNSNGWYIHCPVCRSISLPPNKDCAIGNGAAAFPTNFYINRKRLYPSEKRKAVNRDENGVCSLCPDQNRTLEWFCLPCKKAVCRECVFEHEKDRGVPHQLHKLSDALAKSSNSGNIPTICPDHEGKLRFLFCLTCLTSVCDTCMVDNHQHCVISFLRKDSDRLLAHLEAKTKELAFISDNVWHWTTHIGRCRDDITRKVTTAVEEVAAFLERKKALVLTELNVLYKSQQDYLNFTRLEVATKLKSLNEHMKLINVALRSNGEICLVSRKENAKLRLPKIGILDASLLNMELNFQPNISFLRGVQNLLDFNLGTVSLEAGRWPDPKPFPSLGENIQQWLFANRPKLVSRFCLSNNYDDCSLRTLVFNNYIILADIDKSLLRQYSFDGVHLIKTEFFSSVGGICSWTDSQIVATMPDLRQLYFINHKDLSTRDIQKTTKSYGAVAATSNSFLVCLDSSTSSVDILSPANTCGIEVLKSVPIPSVYLPDPTGCKSLVISADKNFVIADSVQNRLLCLDSRGDLKFVYEESTTPAVCADKKYIYSSDTSRNTVSRLTLDGRLDCVLLTADDGLDHPKCLHINEDSHLVVVQGKTLKSVIVFNIYPFT